MGVMNTSLGVKAFGQTQTAPTSVNSQPQTMSAQDKQKMNGEDVGDILNKVADPNWVDPSKKMRAVGNDQLDKDAFFKLMLAQMKNQDPTNPMKSHEMAAQLANFSGLEQMQNVNKTLTEMQAGQKPLEQYQSLNFIGKAVSGDSSRLARMKGDKSHDFLFTLPGPATDVKVVVKNADGEVVKNYDLKNLKQGENSLSWSGEDEKGNKMPAGEYQFAVEAKNANGQKFNVKTDFSGTITGVNYTPEGPILLVGNQSVRLRDVKKIVDPSLMNNDQKSNNVAGPDLKNANAVGHTEEKKAMTQTQPQAPTEEKKSVEDEGAPAAPMKSKLFESVGLSSEMMGRIAKETQK